MKLSTRARYGTRAMAELASAYPEPAVSVKDIADRQHISAKYLEQIMTGLRTAGLVKAERGMHGGYALTKPPRDITVQDVLEAIEGPIAPVDCVDHPETCELEGVCPIRDTWVEMAESVGRVLKGTTLQDLAERQERKTEPAEPMYYI